MSLRRSAATEAISGWSKTFRCKARDIMRNEAYFAVRRNDPDSYRE
ncbi:MAG: hypothetical protein NTZ51_00490 [Proteobacteria bacterium]|nr:hypothetical protein [Pseudomonadota bacterium]